MALTHHHIWFIISGWGHLTSANALINRMLQLNPGLVTTVVIHAMIAPKVEADLARYKILPRERLNLVIAGDMEVAKLPFNEIMKVSYQQQVDCYFSTLKSLCSTSTQYPTPTVVVFDAYGGNLLLPETKEIAGPNCKYLKHWSASATCEYGMLAPSSESGISDAVAVAEKIYGDEDRRNGREMEEIVQAVCIAKNGSDKLDGTLLDVPGVGKLYDYEREASNTPTPPGLAPMLVEMIKLAHNVDGIICSTSLALEEKAIKACNKYQKLWNVGIQVAPRGWEKNLVIEDQDVKTFLDRHGENEVLYIAFGSMFFPTSSPDEISTLLSTLQSINYPFLLCLGGRTSQNAIPASTIAAINSSGKGWIQNTWVDQQAILSHPSIGFFLTHAGWNSICESLIQGVPMICWPLCHSDQGINAALLSYGLEKKVAFELLQIRLGEARGKAWRTGKEISGKIEDVEKEFRDVFERARGEEGAQLRRNAEELASRLRGEREGGADEVVREVAFI